MTFKSGDVVVLRCGGCRMVVKFHIENATVADAVQLEPGVHCQWHDRRHSAQSAVYAPEALEAAQPGPKS